MEKCNKMEKQYCYKQERVTMEEVCDRKKALNTPLHYLWRILPEYREEVRYDDRLKSAKIPTI